MITENKDFELDLEKLVKEIIIEINLYENDLNLNRLIKSQIKGFVLMQKSKEFKNQNHEKGNKN